MTILTPDRHGSSVDAEYHAFLARVSARFAANTDNGKRPVFRTDASTLWAIYLDSFGNDPAVRQHHNCNTCHHFIKRYGHLVTITPEGRVESAVWNEEDAPELYKPAVRHMARVVALAKVTSQFITALPMLGRAESGLIVTNPPSQWQHLHVKTPVAMLHTARDKTPGQAMAAKREDFKMLVNALKDYSPALLERAVALLRSGTLYRGDKKLPQAEWLLAVKRATDSALSPAHRHAGTWLSVATAPAGFTHLGAGVMSMLLQDLANSALTPAAVKRKFDAAMAPGQYQTAQVAPKAGAIVAAENLVEKLGIARSLPRRFARLAEVPAIWSPRAGETPLADKPGAVFGHIQAKDTAPLPVDLHFPGSSVMTWEKFRRTLLPEAISIEAQVPASTERFAALVTALDPTAPPILQWDSETERNPFSWYYADGIDAEIKKRVLEAGGMHGDVDIRASLIWGNRNDLDLHVQTPNGEHIYFGNKRDRFGGFLDVDRNVGGETTTPIENTRWIKGRTPAGRYLVYVENYRFHEPRLGSTPFRVELEVNGQVWHYDGIMGSAQTGSASRVIVADFHYAHDTIAVQPQIAGGLRKAVGDTTSWGLAAGSMVKVNRLVESPNLWGERKLTQHGRHVFFMLDGCKDTAEGRGRGFFTETLRSDLHGARSTLAAYATTAKIDGAAEADACGLGMSDQAPWNLVLRVKTPAGTHLVKVDRWD